MGDPIGPAKLMDKTLAEDGTWIIVEPFADGPVEDNLNPVCRIFYAASTMICVAASLVYKWSGLGAQAGKQGCGKWAGKASSHHSAGPRDAVPSAIGI